MTNENDNGLLPLGYISMPHPDGDGRRIVGMVFKDNWPLIKDLQIAWVKHLATTDLIERLCAILEIAIDCRDYTFSEKNMQEAKEALSAAAKWRRPHIPEREYNDQSL